MASSSRVQLEAYIAKKSVSGMVLDVGGAQEPLKGRIGEEGEVKYCILDLPNPHEEKVKADIEWDLNYLMDQSYKPFERLDLFGKFDYVACLEVSEYFWNPVVAVTNLAKFLKPEGRLIISFHFVYPNHAPQGLDYLRYTEFGAKKILEECGFEIVEQVDRMCGEYKVNPLDVFNSAEKTHPLKRYDHRKIGVLIEAKKK